MEEVSVQEFYQFLTEKYKDLFDKNFTKNKNIKELIHEIFKKTTIQYISVTVLFQIIVDIIENFKNSNKNNYNLNDYREIKILLSNLYEIINRNNSNIKNLCDIARKVKP